MKDLQNDDLAEETGKRFGCLQVLGIVVVAVLVTVVVTIWAMRAYFFPSDFEPVTLSAQEEKVLTTKLERLNTLDTSTNLDLESSASAGAPAASGEDSALEAEAYTEEGASRLISFSERELNALLANNTDLAKKLALDLSDDLISAKLLLPMDADFPVLGGKTLRLNTGVSFAYENGKPIVVLRGLTIMGVPIPNAWLGGVKNIDLVKEFGADEGFWKTFAAGIAAIEVEEGNLKIEFKE